jgi:molybdate transport system ATP-binding protein
VATHDARFELTTLSFVGGELVVPNLDALPGEPVRVRVRARDVSLALARPSGITIQNVLEGNVVSIGHEFGAIVDVHLRIGETGLTARITRKAASNLALVPGSRVFAMVKAVSIDRRSVGFA